MKKTLICFWVLLICLVGCSEERVCHPVELPLDPNYTVLVDEGSGYCIYTDERETGYYYVIYDNNGYILEHKTTSLRNPRVDFVSDHVIRLTMDASFSDSGCLFFDRQTGMVSQFYSKVVAVKDAYVAYFTGDKVTGNIYLAVENYFDSRKYAAKVTDHGYTQDIFEAECSAYFSNDMKSITVSYIDWDGRTIQNTHSLK